MSNYYNEHDPKASAWLRELIKAGLIPDGDVDERSITEINANELYPYTQCHFFAGIGGWSLALQLAGVPATTQLWTGSCPCQPFSSAGKGLAQADERHLWPVFFNLIKECKPDTVFGEQVANAIGKGWLDGISADLESENYACGATVLGAHSVGAPHIRQRLYWVADSCSIRCNQGGKSRRMGTEELCQKVNESKPWTTSKRSSNSGAASGLANPSSTRLDGHRQSGEQSLEEGWNGTEGHTGTSSTRDQRLVLTNSDRCEQRDIASTSTGHGNTTEPASSRTGRVGNSDIQQTDTAEPGQPLPSERLLRCWDASRLVACRDGKTRRIPTEPAFFPLAHGIPARVVRLRGYGNAIVPQVAAEFVKAFISTLENTPTNE